jgi:hypothetical protein
MVSPVLECGWRRRCRAGCRHARSRGSEGEIRELAGRGGRPAQVVFGIGLGSDQHTAAAKASPAPVTSTTSAGGAYEAFDRIALVSSTPAAPRVTTRSRAPWACTSRMAASSAASLAERAPDPRRQLAGFRIRRRTPRRSLRQARHLRLRHGHQHQRRRCGAPGRCSASTLASGRFRSATSSAAPARCVWRAATKAGSSWSYRPCRPARRPSRHPGPAPPYRCRWMRLRRAQRAAGVDAERFGMGEQGGAGAVGAGGGQQRNRGAQARQVLGDVARDAAEGFALAGRVRGAQRERPSVRSLRSRLAAPMHTTGRWSGST